MEKFTYNIKFTPVFIRVTVGRNPGEPFHILNYNAIYRGEKNIKYLPMSPSKMEIWLQNWANNNQKLLQALSDGRKNRWNEIFNNNLGE